MENKQIKPLTIYLKDFVVYLVHILKKWYFWLSFLPNIAGTVIEYYKIPYEIPSLLNIMIPFIGLLISGYLVYKELFDKVAKENTHNPHIVLSLVEGNEYDFLLSSPYESSIAKLELLNLELNKKESHYEDELLYIEGKLQYWLPNMILTINLRIENDGDVPFDILNLKLNYMTNDLDPLRIHQSEIQINSKNIDFPMILEPTKIELIQYHCVLSPDESAAVSLAQIAASISKLRKSCTITLLVDTLNTLGTQELYRVPIRISFRPLVDDFKSQLQHYQQEGLLRLIHNSVR